MGAASRERVLKTMGKAAQARQRKAERDAGRRRQRPGKRSPGAKGDGQMAGPFGALLAKAIRYASDRGLYVLADGSVQSPTWHIYCRTSGERLLTFSPASRIWSALTSQPGDRGKCGGWRDALDIAAGRRSERA